MPLPKLIASTRPLLGQSLIDKRADLDLIERYGSSDEVRVWLEGARAKGAGALATLADERVLGPLRDMGNDGLPVIPIIPNVSGLVREATEYGMMGAGFRLVRRLGLVNMVRIGFRSLPKAPGVLKRDFGALMAVLYDVEMGTFRRFKPQSVLLHPQICDLALAVGNRGFFEAYASTMRRRYGVEPGVSTNNFGVLAEKFIDWGIDIRLVLTPVNETGWHMRPDREACLAHLARDRFDVIAERPGLLPPPTRTEIDSALTNPAVQTVMIDVGDWDSFLG